MSTNTRLLLCCQCSTWTQAPNPEQGTCTCSKDEGVEFPTNYDTRCLFGLSVQVTVPQIETEKVAPSEESMYREVFDIVDNQKAEDDIQESLDKLE